MNRLNNKGFTLVELLAVLVILIAITSIAIPTINSSLGRSKEKQNIQKQKILESAAELYVAEHKNSFSGECISLQVLKEGNYVDDEAIKDADGKPFSGYILIDGGKFKYTVGSDNCVN